jgi:hypothetical protein
MGMMQTVDSHDLGYYFFPSDQPDDPGHPRLDIYLHKHPTLHHYDPEKIYLAIANKHGFIDQLTVEHPWSGLNSYQICVGRVIMVDRKDARTEAFTYGGKLAIEPGNDYTHCILTSSAPILGLFTEQNIATLLTYETEILLAERRAVDHEKRSTYEQIITQVKPRTLFFACLMDLQDKFEDYPLKDELIFHFTQYIANEIHRLTETDPVLIGIDTLSDVV